MLIEDATEQHGTTDRWRGWSDFDELRITEESAVCDDLTDRSSQRRSTGNCCKDCRPRRAVIVQGDGFTEFLPNGSASPATALFVRPCAQNGVGRPSACHVTAPSDKLLR
ncbi:hypothetical protein OSTOST_21256 [Ostertagia ostertagi]